MRLSVTFIWRSVIHAAFVDSLVAGETGAVHGSGAQTPPDGAPPDVAVRRVDVAGGRGEPICSAPAGGGVDSGGATAAAVAWHAEPLVRSLLLDLRRSECWRARERWRPRCDHGRTV